MEQPVELSEIEKIADLLVESAKVDTKRIPERVFAKVWVPFFFNGENPFNVSLDLWIRFSGGYCRPVFVVADDDPENILFEVPPMFDSSRIVANDANRGQSIYEAVHTAQQLSLQHPNRGNIYIDNFLTDKVVSVQDKAAMKDLATRWNNIFARYGISTELAKVAETTIKTTGTNNSTGFAEGNNDVQGIEEL